MSVISSLNCSLAFPSFLSLLPFLSHLPPPTTQAEILLSGTSSTKQVFPASYSSQHTHTLSNVHVPPVQSFHILRISVALQTLKSNTSHGVSITIRPRPRNAVTYGNVYVLTSSWYTRDDALSWNGNAASTHGWNARWPSRTSSIARTSYA
jgi:hypothetical protein